MDQQEFIKFIQEIVKNGGTAGTNLALKQFADILERNNFDKNYVEKVKELSGMTKEVGNLKKVTHMQDIHMDDVDEAIRQGRIRKKLEEADRRGNC